MKKILTYLLLLSGVIYYSCDKPAPTELTDENNNDDGTEYEIVTENLNDNYYNSGADTSGITQDLTGRANIISVSGIKITNGNSTERFSLAQAIFFDLNKPVRLSNGKIIGYETIVGGNIKFDNHNARIVPHKIRFRDRGMLKDTTLGGKYMLFKGKWGHDPFEYNYNSSIQFQYSLLGFPLVDFDIPTPPEINGSLVINGTRNERNIQARVKWNGRGFGKVIIVVGVIKNGQNFSIPVYKIKTRDDGELIIPRRFFSNFPFEEFGKIVFTLVRSYEDSHTGQNSTLFVSSQSIHSIVIEIP